MKIWTTWFKHFGNFDGVKKIILKTDCAVSFFHWTWRPWQTVKSRFFFSVSSSTCYFLFSNLYFSLYCLMTVMCFKGGLSACHFKLFSIRKNNSQNWSRRCISQETRHFSIGIWFFILVWKKCALGKDFVCLGVCLAFFFNNPRSLQRAADYKSRLDPLQLQYKMLMHMQFDAWQALSK